MPTLQEQLDDVEAKITAYLEGTDVPYYQNGEEIVRDVPYTQLVEHQKQLREQIAAQGGNGSSFSLGYFDANL